MLSFVFYIRLIIVYIFFVCYNSHIMFFQRTKYLNTVLEARKTHRIILVGGLPGTGINSFLASVTHELKTEKPPVRMVYLRHDDTTGTRDILQQARALGVGPSVLVIENADTLDGLPEALDRILAEYSATVLLSARHEQILDSVLRPIFGKLLHTIRLSPLSYPEFLEAHSIRDSMHSLELYVENGGLIHHALLPPDSPDRFSLLRFRADSFLLGEIVERFTVRNPRALRELLRFVARHTGESLSSRQIQDAFSSRNMTISPQAVLDYLGYCAESGLLVPVPVYDLSRKKTLDSGMSWYFGDSGLRCAFTDKDRPGTFDHALANLVFLYLVDSGRDVQQGRIIRGNGSREDISFVCNRNGERMYLQMAGSAATAAEQLRKRSALLSLRDGWPKYMIGAYGDEQSEDGIRQLSVRELLLGQL